MVKLVIAALVLLTASAAYAEPLPVPMPERGGLPTDPVPITIAPGHLRAMPFALARQKYDSVWFK